MTYQSDGIITPANPPTYRGSVLTTAVVPSDDVVPLTHTNPTAMGLQLQQINPIGIESGMVSVYDNGTKFFVSLQFAHPLFPEIGYCRASYICENRY